MPNRRMARCSLCGTLQNKQTCDKCKNKNSVCTYRDYHSLYDHHWRKARITFLSQHIVCTYCEQEGFVRIATEIHHEPRHGGDYDRFWDVSTWRPICRKHHIERTKEERKGG